MKRIFNIIILIFALQGIQGQDTIFVLTEEKFIQMVLRYHPVARQADLIVDRGEFTVKKARGGFDPYLYTSFDQKQFDEKEYFSILGSGLKVPTWFGLDLKFGYDRNQGAYLNPERNAPDNGLLHAGISVPIGEGLFIDERRKALQQAKIFSEFTLADQNRVLNDLLLNSLKSYWYWVKFYQQFQVYQESVEIAQQRFVAIRNSYLQGDKPAVDTLEAFIQVQNRQISENQALIDYRNASLELSNFLWFDKNVPLEITDLMRPPSREELSIVREISESELQATLIGIEETHPDLQLYQYKLADLSIEQRWKREK